MSLVLGLGSRFLVLTLELLLLPKAFFLCEVFRVEYFCSTTIVRLPRRASAVHGIFDTEEGLFFGLGSGLGNSGKYFPARFAESLPNVLALFPRGMARFTIFANWGPATIGEALQFAVMAGAQKAKSFRLVCRIGSVTCAICCLYSGSILM